MEILGLDKHFKVVKKLDYICLEWIERYYNFGEYLLQLPASMYDYSIAYIYSESKNKVGIVNKKEYTDDINGQIIEISGFFLEYFLIDKVVYPLYRKQGNIETVARELVETYKKDIPNLELGQINNLGDFVSFEEGNAELGRYLFTLLETQELSYRTNYDFEQNKMYFEVWQGLDKTQGQIENPYLVFSHKRRNLNKADVISDNSNFKNYGIVVGNGAREDGKQKVVYIDKSNGGYKKEIYIDLTGILFDEEEQTEAEYLEILRQKGEEKLLEYYLVENISLEIITDDVNLGDKVDVEIEDLNLITEARSIEVYEVYKENQKTKTITLGNQKVKNYIKRGGR